MIIIVGDLFSKIMEFKLSYKHTAQGESLDLTAFVGDRRGEFEWCLWNDIVQR